MYKIYQFSRESGESEFIVISEDPQEAVLEEFLEEGFQLDDTFDIDGDACGLPCDRQLS